MAMLSILFSALLICIVRAIFLPTFEVKPTATYMGCLQNGTIIMNFLQSFFRVGFKYL